MSTQPGIPNELTLSTSCYGTRLKTIEDQAFAAVAMGFRRLEIGLSDAPVPLNGFEQSQRETGITVRSMVAGCMNPRSENMSGTRLASLDEDKRERALNSVRQHVQTALHYGCPTVVIRGCEVEDAPSHTRGMEFHRRVETEPVNEDLRLEVRDFVQDVQKRGQRQVEYLCRSLHKVLREYPEIRLAIEPGHHFNDLLGFESVGWVLEDFNTPQLGYWHDTGRIHVREIAGLPSQGEWLETFGKRILGVHLQDAAGTQVEIPPGSGEVDFKLVASYLPAEAERVVEINPRHGRGEILSAVQFLVDQGF